MSIPHDENHTNSSLLDLSNDLEDIYRNYASRFDHSTRNPDINITNNNSVETLDSQKNQYINLAIAKRLQNNGPLPQAHISSRLSSLQVTEDGELVARSAPQTPTSSSSFDFTPHPHNALTSSSLNVLLDTPTTESEFKDLIASAPMVERSPDSPLPSYRHHQPPPPPTSNSAVLDANPNHVPEQSSPSTLDDTPTTTYLIGRAIRDDDNDYDNDDDDDENDIENNDNYDSNSEIDDSGIPDSLIKEKNDHEWVERGAAVRKIPANNSNDNDNDDESAPSYRIIRRTVKDFKFGRSLGEGSYSTVVLATDKHTSKQYAVKILDKRHIIKEKKVKYVNIEKHALNRLSNRMGVISLYFTFQDKASLYFVLDYASNGELLSLIKKYGTLSEECTRHFAAQILDAIQYMHDNGVIHRDIKPENILLDDELRVQITDFGTARLLEKKNDESEDYPVDVRAKSFVGTAEYVSPELLENKYCGKPGDIWAFGCIVYQMIAGKPPFRAANEYLTFQKITKLQYAFSAGFPMIIRDLIKQILVLQPSRRATIKDIKDHFFFQSINFDDFDQIWLSEVPELGPYKMNAKSMMKVPELSKSASQSQLNSKKNYNNGNVRNNGNNRNNTDKRVVSEGVVNHNKLVNPASVAAFVLKNDKRNNADEEEEVDGDLPDLSKTASNSSFNNTSPRNTINPQPDYIPGTNILRPTIPTRTSYSRGSVSNQLQNPKRGSASKPKSRVMEVSPLSSLESTWQEYLNHPDERIMRIGPVFVYKQPTDLFERRNRGLLHNAPLGLASKLQATNGTIRGNGSLLTQVVNGSKSGLRNHNDNLNDENSFGIDDENNAITNHMVFDEDTAAVPESPSRSGTSESTQEASTSKIGKSIFKKFLSHSINNEKKDHGTDTTNGGDHGVLENSNEGQDPFGRARTCTVLITTHGRVLIFIRVQVGDSNDCENFKLVSEIKLNYPFIQFKEVVSSTSGRLSKQVPTTGLFAIESIYTTFVFEVESYEINQWTEALARSKINQFERDREGESQRSRSNLGNSSPRLMDAPTFTKSPTNTMNQNRRISDSNYTDNTYSTPKSTNSTTPRQRARTSSANNTPNATSIPSPTTTSTPGQPDKPHGGMLANRIKQRASIKRKPPPPIKGSSLANRNPSGPDPDDNVMLHAAQLAVSASAHTPSTDNRRSSFTKENNAGIAKVGASVGSTVNKIAYKFNQQPTQSPKITSMNSKLLARSQRKK